MASTFTNRRDFEKPGDGDASWDTPLNANFDACEEELTYSSSKFRNQLHGQNTFSSITRWEQVAVSSAQGGAAIEVEFGGATFDGRYVYFSPIDAETVTRYDTQGVFRDITSWDQIAANSAVGGTTPLNLFNGVTFDGRYVYLNTFNSDSFVRYDTSGVFDDITSWQNLDMRSGHGGASAPDAAFRDISFDGRYVYFAPANVLTMTRYDTAGSFLSITSWEQVAVSSAQGGVSSGSFEFGGISFDGRYMYYIPINGDTFVRFDTTGAFTDHTGAWEQIGMNSAQGAAVLDGAYVGCVFDGRYIYAAGNSSDTMVRFDAQGAFTDITNWEQVAQSSAIGGGPLDNAFSGISFDGRYIYMAPFSNVTSMIRFDTAGAFTDIADWHQVAVSSAVGSATAIDQDFSRGCFDGRWMYFAPYDSDTVVRFAANTTSNPGPTEYDQVSS